MEIENGPGKTSADVASSFHMPIYGITYSNRVLLDEENLFIFIICVQKLVSKAVSRVGDQLVPAVSE